MRQVIIGIYPIGHQEVELIMREGDGGDLWLTPEPGKIPRIKIGGDYEHWSDIVRLMIHEATEMILLLKECRFERSGYMGNDHAQYVFIFDHSQFSDVCSKLSMFLVPALPDVARAWKKWKRK